MSSISSLYLYLHLSPAEEGWYDPLPPAAAGQQPRPEAEGAVRGDGVVTLGHHRQVHRSRPQRVQGGRV